MCDNQVCQPPTSRGPPAGSLLASCSLACPFPQFATLLGPPATALPRVLSARLRVSARSTGLYECFFFNFSVVGLSYSLIFCQFWLFFVFKLLSFFWLCKEAQYVYLCLHLGWKADLLYHFYRLYFVYFCSDLYYFLPSTYFGLCLLFCFCLFFFKFL